MGFSGCFKRVPSCQSASFASFLDSIAFHLCNLRKDGEDKFTNAFGDRAKAEDIDDDAFLEQPTNVCLNINGIASEAINGNNAKCVTFSNVVQHRCEAWPVTCRRRSAHALVGELAVKRTAQRGPLGINQLVTCRYAVICNSTQFFLLSPKPTPSNLSLAQWHLR